MIMLEEMPIPENFGYLNVLLKEKPVHQKLDAFFVNHPPMDPVQRSKIFSPFDALKGHKEAIESKNVQCDDRPDICEEDAAEINRRLNLLQQLTRNSRLARDNQLKITVTVFVPCADKNHAAYGQHGRIEKVTGICTRTDSAVSRSMTVGQTTIRFRDILWIDGDGIFDGN